MAGGHYSDHCPLEAYEAALEEDPSYCRCMTCGEEGHINCGDAQRSVYVQEAVGWRAGDLEVFNQHDFVKVIK